MRVNSDQSSSFIDFEPLPELSSYSFRITAELSGRCVSYGDIALLNPDVFLSNLETVLQKQSGRAVLEGSYDFNLAIEFDEHSKLWASFYLAEYIAMAELPDRDFMRLSLQGSFTLSSDRIGQLLSDFRSVFV